MSTPPTVVLLLASIAALCSGQPILPSLSYPVFILTPPDILKTNAPYSTPVEIQTHPPHHAVPIPPEQGYEVSQFHSQDELGRVVFGFHGPDQSRMESRAMDGSIRGSYSYVDPNGNIVKMQYWDDGSGFHVTGNALPNGQPAYTPEVAAARAQHLRLYQAALLAAQQFGTVSDESDSYNSSPDDSNRYSDSQFDKGNNGNSLFLDDTDSVSLDNPELYGDFNYQNEENKDKDKPSISDVEGEVELGEDVGPEEDEEEPQNDDDDDVQQNDEQNDFRKQKTNKKEVEGKLKTQQGTLFKTTDNYGKNENEKEHSYHLKDPDSDQHSDNDEPENEEDQRDEIENHEEENHSLEENQEDEENHNVEEEHNEEENQDDRNQEEEKNHDEVEAHDEVDDTDDPHDAEDDDDHDFDFRGNFNDRHDEVRQEEESIELTDADTAENRKTLVPHTIPGNPQQSNNNPVQNKDKHNSQDTNGNNNGKERIEDQLYEKSNINSYVSDFDPSRAFFYHYQHIIPKPIERVDTEAEKSPLVLLNKAQALGQPSLIMQAPAIVQPQSDLHNQPSAMIKQSLIPNPSLIFHSPPSEVHDAQISPLQISSQNTAGVTSEKVR